MIIQQSMRLKVLILPLSLAGAVVIAIFFIKPSFSEMMTFRDASATKGKQLENLKDQTQKLQAMKTKWEAMAEEKNLIETAFPEMEDVDSYISEITSKASRSGVLLIDIKMSQKNSGGTGQSQNSNYICGEDLAGGAQSAGASTTPQPQATGGAAMTAVPGASDIPVSSSSCLKAVPISLSVKGSWEQILDFFKYLEDMNRISNVETVAISTETLSQDQAASDVLSVDISANAFFKEKNQSGSMALASNLAGQGSFNQKSLEKLKETIYAPYDAPTMSPGGQRNIFK